MKWRVEGADRNTGEDFVLEIEAEDEGTARSRATARGMLVTRATPVTAPIVAHVERVPAPVQHPTFVVPQFYAQPQPQAVAPAPVHVTVNQYNTRRGTGCLTWLGLLLIFVIGCPLSCLILLPSVDRARSTQTAQRPPVARPSPATSAPSTEPTTIPAPVPEPPLLDARRLPGLTRSEVDRLLTATGSNDGDYRRYIRENTTLDIRFHDGRAAGLIAHLDPEPESPAAAFARFGLAEPELRVTFDNPGIIRRYEGRSAGVGIRAASVTKTELGWALLVVNFEGYPLPE